MFATTGAQAVALFAVLSAASTTVNAFSPVFSTPRQCDSLKITWSSMELPPSTHGLTEFTMSFPLDDPKHHTPSPYTLTVPCTMLDEEGVVEVPALPFRAGTQFFASAHFPGASGPVRRMVSDVLTVEHSTDADCLDTAMPPNAKRPRVKTFGKRQVNVIGATTVGASASAAPASSAAPGVPINVIGVGVIPSGAAGSSQAASSTSGASTSSASAPAASGAVPPIRVIGSSNIPASGSGNPDTPANAAPAPSASSTGSVQPINVIGPGFIPANGGSSTSTAYEGAPTTIIVDNGTLVTSTESSTSCTETPSAIETPTYEDEEEPCEDDLESTVVHGRPTSTRTRPAAAINTEVVQYSQFDDMVNAANSAFHAWNPYKPPYSPST